MKTKNHFPTILTIAFLFMMAITSGCSRRQVHSENLVQYLGTKAPAFTLEDIDGQVVNSQMYEDKILVIHIATTWCPYCNAEASHLQRLSEEYQDQVVEVLIIDVKEEKELVRNLLTE